MKEVFIAVFLCVIGSGELTGEIAPKLTMVATVEGKSFYLDVSFRRNRSDAFSYCNSLGMRLAEITSLVQFDALDQAKAEGWVTGDGAWIGGIMTRDLNPYIWESSNASLDHSYLPFEDSLTENARVSVIFVKNGITGGRSFVSNSLHSTRWSGTLCETFNLGE